MPGTRQVVYRPSELPTKDCCILLLKTKPIKEVKPKQNVIECTYYTTCVLLLLYYTNIQSTCTYNILITFIVKCDSFKTHCRTCYIAKQYTSNPARLCSCKCCHVCCLTDSLSTAVFRWSGAMTRRSRSWCQILEVRGARRAAALWWSSWKGWPGCTSSWSWRRARQRWTWTRYKPPLTSITPGWATALVCWIPI